MINNIFTDESIKKLKGNLGIGHTRYSTSAASEEVNCQPFVVHTAVGPIALAHNGELVNCESLRGAVLGRGVGLSTHSDSELITQSLCVNPPDGEVNGPDWPARLRHLMTHHKHKLAKYCDEIFGDLLLKEALPDFPLEPGAPLPPPSALKRKILIKNKRLKSEVEKQELELFLQGEFVIEDDIKEDAGAVKLPPDELAAAAATSSNAQSQDGGDAEAVPIQYTGSTTNVHPWLSSMVNYAQPIKFQGFDIADQKNIHHNMSSFAETTGISLLKTQAIDFVNYNKRQMSRIYPKGTRADSSNYMPQVS